MLMFVDKDNVSYFALTNQEDVLWSDEQPTKLVGENGGFKYIARDKDGALHIYTDEPYKEEGIDEWVIVNCEYRRITPIEVHKVEDKEFTPSMRLSSEPLPKSGDDTRAADNKFASKWLTVRELIDILEQIPDKELPVKMSNGFHVTEVEHIVKSVSNVEGTYRIHCVRLKSGKD